MYINFTGAARIQYQSPKQFEKTIQNLHAQEVCPFPKYCFHNKVTSDKPMFSQYANTCSILDINDTMVHLAPETRTHDLMQKITNLVKKEKDEKGDVTAFIIGGQNNDTKSFDLFNDIGNVLDKEGVDFSMICGKRDSARSGRDALLKNGDTFIFTQENNPQMSRFIEQNKSLTGDGLKKVFELFYDIVELAPNHKIVK